MGVRHMTREQKQMARRLKTKGMTLKAMPGSSAVRCRW